MFILLLLGRQDSFGFQTQTRTGARVQKKVESSSKTEVEPRQAAVYSLKERFVPVPFLTQCVRTADQCVTSHCACACLCVWPLLADEDVILPTSGRRPKYELEIISCTRLWDYRGQAKNSFIGDQAVRLLQNVFMVGLFCKQVNPIGILKHTSTTFSLLRCAYKYLSGLQLNLISTCVSSIQKL